MVGRERSPDFAELATPFRISKQFDGARSHLIRIESGHQVTGHTVPHDFRGTIQIKCDDRLPHRPGLR